MVPKMNGKSCELLSLWMPPGSHQLTINGKPGRSPFKPIKRSAQEAVHDVSGISPTSRSRRGGVLPFAFLCAAQPLSAQETDGQSAALRNSGEVEILGARGVQVSVDQKPVLTLPLFSSVTISRQPATSPQHRMGRLFRRQSRCERGRALEVRFNFEVQAVSMTVPPHALLLEKYEGIPSALADELAIATVRSLSNSDWPY